MDCRSTAICYGLHVMMFIAKIAGYPFANICGKKEDANSMLYWLIWGPLRLAYSVICIGLSSCIGLVFVAIAVWLNGRTNQIEFVTRSGVYIVIYGQVLFNFCNLLFRRTLLADIVNTAAKLEPGLRLDMERVQRRLRKVALLCLLYTLIDAFKYVVGRRGQIKVAYYLLQSYDDHFKRLFVPWYIASCFLVSTWYNMVFWQIVYFSSLFREYFAALCDRLEFEMAASESRVESKGLPCETVRLNLVELQKLLRKVNSFIGGQALWYYCGSVFFLCAMLYNTATASNVGAPEVASSWSYVVMMAAGVVFSTAAASRMTREIVGSVITYTVVLVQTSESIMANKCSKGPQ
ncbi:hypothetical protein HPB50_003252 [Hyalomma asiaticum]|uniref:Uncharacterized protein n=1 Tax=Hyalomma asiaticum TaxID=266040 RepID=A0ACB7RLU2_HYAAI|nr:hypothetical protein HPB50_003252 [Hyalomma asiaticum]